MNAAGLSLPDCRWRHRGKWCFNRLNPPMHEPKRQSVANLGKIGCANPRNLASPVCVVQGTLQTVPRCHVAAGRPCPCGNAAAELPRRDSTLPVRKSLTTLPLLLHRAGRGDGVALAELMQKYERALRGIAKTLIGSCLRARFDIEDLVQSAHLALLPRLQSEEYPITGWAQLFALYRTTLRNLVVDRLRHVRVEREQGPAACAHSLAASLGEGDPSVAIQFADSVTHLIQALDPADGRLVELLAQGLSTAQIAKTLGLKAQAVRTRISRLRDHFQKRGCANLP